MSEPSPQKPDWISRVAAAAMAGPMPLLPLLTALVGGAVALVITPREEEPQIIVPMADVLVSAPGLSAGQVERQIATPLEKLLYQIDGVEYVYSMSRPERCVVTVRFFVGEDRVESLVKIYNKIYSQTGVVKISPHLTSIGLNFNLVFVPTFKRFQVSGVRCQVSERRSQGVES